jgi:predicted Zn-dependent protease
VAEEFLSAHPDDPWAQNSVAWGLGRLEHELDRALALAERALATLGPQPAVLDTLAVLHLAAGEPRRALARIDLALEQVGEDPAPRLRYVRARALNELGRAREARAELERSLAATAPDPAEPWLDERRRFAAQLGLEPGSAPTP